MKPDCSESDEVDRLPKKPDEISEMMQFDGILHRFHRTELKPINFGLKQDCGALMICYFTSFFVYHIISLLFWVLEQRKTVGSYFDYYFDDKSLMAGLLLTSWFLGYNVVSYIIYAQFECRLERDAPPDDFEFVTAGEALDTGLVDGEAGDEKAAEQFASQTLLVTMPSGELVIGTNTRSQSHGSAIMYSKGKDSRKTTASDENNDDKV